MTLFDELPPTEASRIGIRAATVIEKAETGPGVAMFNWGTPIGSMYGRRSPQKVMREAQTLYHSNPWVHSAEATVTRRVVGLPWHLEDENDEELDENGPGKLVHDLLEAPLGALKPTGNFISWKDNPVPPSPKTWAGLIELTSRHMGLCGLGAWYLDQTDAVYGFPLSILYLNPARLWAATDEAGNLTGWVLDPKDEHGRGGVPLSVGEVLPFYLNQPDAGHYGTGLVEVASLKAQITTLADRHAAYVLTTGGRLAGIVSPKEGSIPDDKFQALVREFRNLVEHEDAAKRTTILQGPIDFTPTAASPDELDLLDLSKMNRDDIYAIWGVPPAMAGIPSPAGLNSGDARKWDEMTLMQGAVHDRVQNIRETIQHGLLDRLPTVVELEIEEPSFDDEAPAYEIASKARELPLTNRERRELVGLDPFGVPEIDEAVWLPVGLTEAYPGGPTGPTGAPEPNPVPPALAPFTGLPPTPEMAEKSRIGDAMQAAHDRYVKRAVVDLRKLMTAFLAVQRDEIAAKVERNAGHLAKRPKDTSTWWDGSKWDKRLMDVLTPHYARTYDEVGKRVASLFEGKADPVGDATLTRILKRGAKRVTKINETTRDAIRTAVVAGMDIGEGAAALGARIAAAAVFDEYRGELVARTETMFAWNGAAIESYRDVGVEMVEPQDGDADEMCAARMARGAVPLDEAMDDEDHPNGTLAWNPVITAEQLALGRELVQELGLGKAQLSAAQINDLPDSDFLYIEPGGTKDDTGRTVPRSLRHFPVPDIAHVRNALARIPQSNLPAEVKARCIAKARAMLDRMTGKAEDDMNAEDVRRIVTEMIGKSYTTDQPAAIIQTPIYLNQLLPSQEPPTVNITNEVPVPSVHVAPAKAAEVTVNVAPTEQPTPIVNVTMPEGKAADIINVRIVEQPEVRKTVKRDMTGKITEVLEQ